MKKLFVTQFRQIHKKPAFKARKADDERAKTLDQITLERAKSALKAPFNPKYPTIEIIGNILFTFRTIFIALLKDNSALKAHSARFAHS